MPTEAQSLETFLHQVVRTTYESRLSFRDAEITAYVARVLCDFSEPENLFRIRDAKGRRVEDIHTMVRASDPVFGTAASFDAERRLRKYIGDYALFAAGMCHEILETKPGVEPVGPTLEELIRIGKESYAIVSQFNLEEYEKDAPLFARLTESFEHCVIGLAWVREEMGQRLRLYADRQ